VIFPASISRMRLSDLHWLDAFVSEPNSKHERQLAPVVHDCAALHSVVQLLDGPIYSAKAFAQPNPGIAEIADSARGVISAFSQGSSPPLGCECGQLVWPSAAPAVAAEEFVDRRIDL
jgi:hypothetical protein